MKKYFSMLLAAVAMMTISCDPTNVPNEPTKVPLLPKMAKEVMGQTPQEVEQTMKTFNFTKQKETNTEVEYRDADNRPVTIAFNNDHAVILRSIGLDRSTYTINDWVEAGPYLLECHDNLTRDYKWGQVQGSVTSPGWNEDAYDLTDVSNAILKVMVYDSIPMGDVHFTVDYFTSLTTQRGPEAHFQVNFKDGKDVQIFFNYSDLEMPEPEYIYPNIGELTALTWGKPLAEAMEVLKQYGITEQLDYEEDHYCLMTNNNGFTIHVVAGADFFVDNYVYPMVFDNEETVIKYITDCVPGIQGFTSWKNISVELSKGTSEDDEGLLFETQTSTPAETFREVCQTKLETGNWMRLLFAESDDPQYQVINTIFDLEKISSDYYNLRVQSGYINWPE